MIVLTEEELENLMVSTGTYKLDTPLKIKEEYKNAFRKVEKETNEQIMNAGGVTNWYERGRN